MPTASCRTTTNSLTGRLHTSWGLASERSADSARITSEQASPVTAVPLMEPNAAKVPLKPRSRSAHSALPITAFLHPKV